MDARLALLAALAALVALAGCGGAGLDAPEAEPASPDEPTASPTSAAAQLRVTVTEVVDGDTVKVRFRNGTRDTVRLVGVDTPEVHSENTPGEFEGVPDTVAGRNCLRRWGARASQLAKERLAGREVGLAFDPNLDRRGFYGRLLAYVVVENGTFNRELVASGHARVYDSNFARTDRYLAAERRARQDGRGLWTCATDPGTPSPTATPTATADGGGSPLAIVAVHADAAGNDNENLNDEYVTFENRGESALDLRGWTVRDEAGHVYTFSDATLAPGERVTLHTGDGTDTAESVYWGRSSAVWNNAGDVVTVRNAEGTLVARHAY